ncbi:MAG: N(G),N(G)-dimethylarginine dimethylaminohydrolase [Bacteroidales bacterium]|nr:N(G),N(G)-dimethylarginine dimethylaminohydrolase [Bacteroidales bacterium]
MFTRAIVRKPCKNMVNGITSADYGIPSYENALYQHSNYVEVLKKCGLQVHVTESNEQFPDSVFVEDTALLTPSFAVITNPGAQSRKGEVVEMEATLKKFFPTIEHITSPGTLDAGDVMMVGRHFYIGLSKRTNPVGAAQLIYLLKKYGFSGSTISLKSVLHLKTGVSYLENNYMLACGEFVTKTDFGKYHIIEIPQTESYAANSLWVNGYVLVPKGYPRTLSLIKREGFSTIEVDVSEFRKLDGGLSCLSLRF